PSDREIDT
ncbi:unnamed protein product, partial [Allacma fusca]